MSDVTFQNRTVGLLAGLGATFLGMGFAFVYMTLLVFGDLPVPFPEVSPASTERLLWLFLFLTHFLGVTGLVLRRRFSCYILAMSLALSILMVVWETAATAWGELLAAPVAQGATIALGITVASFFYSRVLLKRGALA